MFFFWPFSVYPPRCGVLSSCAWCKISGHFHKTHTLTSSHFQLCIERSIAHTLPSNGGIQNATSPWRRVLQLPWCSHTHTRTPSRCELFMTHTCLSPWMMQDMFTARWSVVSSPAVLVHMWVVCVFFLLFDQKSFELHLELNIERSEHVPDPALESGLWDETLMMSLKPWGALTEPELRPYSQ